MRENCSALFDYIQVVPVEARAHDIQYYLNVR